MSIDQENVEVIPSTQEMVEVMGSKLDAIYEGIRVMKSEKERLVRENDLLRQRVVFWRSPEFWIGLSVGNTLWLGLYALIFLRA